MKTVVIKSIVTVLFGSALAIALGYGAQSNDRAIELISFFCLGGICTSFIGRFIPDDQI